MSVLEVLHQFLQRTPLAVAVDEDGMAHPAQPLARYWQTGVWTRVFEGLLNSDSPAALLAARKELQTYLTQNPARARLLRLALSRLESGLDLDEGFRHALGTAPGSL